MSNKITDIKFDFDNNCFVLKIKCQADIKTLLCEIETYNYFNLSINNFIDDETFEILNIHSDFLSAKKYIFKILNTKTISSIDIKNILSKKMFNYKIIEKCIKYFTDINLINDDLYIKNFIHDKLIINKYGKYKIIALLKSKGFNQIKINKSINCYFDDLSKMNIETIQKINMNYLLTQKIDTHKIQNSKNKMYKIMNYLASKGYPKDMIYEAIKLFEKDILE